VQLTHSTAGGAVGVDYRTATWLVGVAAGGSASTFAVPDRTTSGQLDGGHVGLYGIGTWNQLYAAATLSYAHFDSTTTRRIAMPGITENAQGRFGSDMLGGRIEAGWRQPFGAFVLSPFAALQFAQLWQVGYAETSTTVAGTPGILGLGFAAKTVSSLPLFVGAQAETRMTMPDGAVWTPWVRASWVHEFEPTREVTPTFLTLPTATFTVEGPRAASDSGRLDLGSRLVYGERFSLFGTFYGEFSDRSRSYGGNGGVTVKW